MKINNIQNSNFNSKKPMRHRREVAEGDTIKKIGVATTSVCATLLPLLAISKRQRRMPSFDLFKKADVVEKVRLTGKALNIEYGFKEMMFVGLTSILGGVTGGVLFDKEVNPKKKIQEGVNKAFALSVPATLVAGALEASKRVKIKQPYAQIASVLFGVGLGMPLANKISNKINKKAFGGDCFEKRKIKADDYLMHVDDVVGALALSKAPIPGLDVVLSAIYAHEGYEAGSVK